MIDKRLKNSRPIVAVSGGKDSTAMCLHLFELGYTKNQFDRVFCDTGWESNETYKYLDELEKTIGPIKRIKSNIPVKEEHKKYVDHFEERLGFKSDFVRICFKKASFPTRHRKWCTELLKLDPILNYFETLDYDYVKLVGIRRQESIKRSTMDEWEWNNKFDCWVWRPLIMWSEKQVIDIHHRFNLIPNRLYLNGSSRVGCYPCIFSRKKEINLLTADRVSIIRDLESILNKLRHARTDISEEKKNNWSPLSFFLPQVKGLDYIGIDQVMEWAKTSRGGKQFELFTPEEPTCVKWGLCEFK